MKSGECQQIEQEAVLAQVSQGLLEINAELETDYAISQILFVPSDTPFKSVYRYLVVELIKRIDSQGVFLVV
ncbi:hypothetical protein H8L32_11550 [Undibacterium sp. CY18W]|uniref:Uncharacterized protein n=1 Tax=Undibacterium hunanense TaxID=2762292 RepID=A0ABR6ZQL8_9BURK|nr:hypothetical protein [Undibacterium hunanense]MBC3918114.1 hypothetical protein [Undibacterium hunanense]